MIIDVDMGNSRVKWRGPDLVVRAVELNQWQSLFECSYDEAVQVVRVSSVVDPSLELQFMQSCRTKFGFDAYFAKPCDGLDGLKLAYQNPGRLGVDRWLAMLAARRLSSGRSFIVISAGTAVTADMVSDQGRHLGGFIAPGIKAASAALATQASRLPGLGVALDADWGPGESTQRCMQSGFSALYQGFLQCLILRATECIPGFCTLFTGGDGDQLFNLVGDQPDRSYHPTLVLDGLQVIGCP